MNKNLTPEAKSALLAARSSRQGERVPGAAKVLDELSLAGLVGAQDGLTRSGTIARNRAMAELEEML